MAVGHAHESYSTRCRRCGAVRHDQGLGNEERPDCLGWATGQPCGGCWCCRLVAVFREVRRVLHPTGTCWVNCGDAFAHDGPSGPQGMTGDRASRTFTAAGAGGRRTGLPAKNLLMLPARLALALQADGWWLRQDISWVKTAPMPESVRDRFTSSWEHVFLLAKRPHYFFDIEACREPSVSDHGSGNGYKRPARLSYDGRGQDTQWTMQPTRQMRNSWILNPEPTPFAHFATFPSALVRRCLLAACSAGGVCAGCGTPYRRQVDRVTLGRTDAIHTTTTGFAPACTCASGVQPATVLDPFAGAGTTLLTARDLFIRSVGIELNPAYCALAASRLTQGVLALAPGG